VGAQGRVSGRGRQRGSRETGEQRERYFNTHVEPPG
jgi:hypothetical protein